MFICLYMMTNFSQVLNFSPALSWFGVVFFLRGGTAPQ